MRAVVPLTEEITLNCTKAEWTYVTLDPEKLTSKGSVVGNYSPGEGERQLTLDHEASVRSTGLVGGEGRSTSRFEPAAYELLRHQGL